MTYTDGREAMYSGTNAREISNTVFSQTDDNGNHVDIITPNGILDMVSDLLLGFRRFSSTTKICVVLDAGVAMGSIFGSRHRLDRTRG